FEETSESVVDVIDEGVVLNVPPSLVLRPKGIFAEEIELWNTGIPMPVISIVTITATPITNNSLLRS
ncbi:MAG: hypothetical protein KIY11_02355, partial [Thermoplasmata archaeon]|nr:hypothetical protein [Candidatus Sysuiplasma acidicola]